MRGPLRFKQRDVTRATRAVLAAGLQVKEVRVDKNGDITLVPAQPQPSEAAETPLDGWMSGRAREA